MWSLWSLKSKLHLRGCQGSEYVSITDQKVLSSKSAFFATIENVSEKVPDVVGFFTYFWTVNFVEKRPLAT